MKKEAKVHMLPTEDKSILYKRNDTNELHLGDFNYCESDDKLRTNQHLYITTDEEIKKGDCFINLGSGGHPGVAIYQANSENSKAINEFKFPEIKKIIATTDTELHYNKVVEEDMHMYKESLPHIPQHIIEAYIKKPFDEVLVEYEVKLKSYHIEPYEEVMLKTDSNNCTIIHPVEDKMYSRDTLDKILKECYRGGVDGVSWEEIAKRIEENL
jgi:hypothetical protein